MQTRRGGAAPKIIMVVFVLLILAGAWFVINNLPSGGNQTISDTTLVQTGTDSSPTKISATSSSQTSSSSSTASISHTTTSSSATSTVSSTSTDSTTSSVFSSTTSTVTTTDLCDAATCAPLFLGWLHTVPDNTNIYDSQNRVVQLEGVNAIGLEFGTGSNTPDSCGEGYGLGSLNFSASEFNSVAAWGFNVVRVPITWENLEPTEPTLAANGSWVHQWNAPYLNELDYVIQQFGQRGIGVILDMSQVDVSSSFQQPPETVQGGECEGWGNPTWLYPSATSPTTEPELASAMCSFFTDQSLVGGVSPSPIEAMEAAEHMVASRYASDPSVVGLDIFNEPWFASGTPCGATQTADKLLMSFDSKMAQTISAANPHILIIFEDALSSLASDAPILTAAPDVPNVVYSVHIYTSGWHSAEPLLSAQLANAKKWGVPLYLGEFDGFGAGNGGAAATLDPSWQSDTQALLSTCASDGISWTFFSYYSLGPHSNAQVPSSQILAVLQQGISFR